MFYVSATTIVLTICYVIDQMDLNDVSIVILSSLSSNNE